MSLTTITTLTVKKGASTASVSLKRDSDGSIYFTDTAGNKVITHSNEFARRLFAEIDALV